MNTNPLVGVVMGSDSDWPVMKAAAEALDEFAVPYEADVVSAHRMPHEMIEYGSSAERRGLRVIIAGAGQVRRAARARDDHAQAAAFGRRAVLDHFVRHPVRGYHVGLVTDAELVEGFGRGLHHRPVRVAAHHDADHGLLAHSPSSLPQRR